VLTNNLVIDDKRADIFKNYVKNGGKLIIDGRFGVINDESLVNRDLPGGKMNELCGVDYLDSDYEQLDFTYNGIKVKGYYMRDLVEVTTGEIKGIFGDGRCAVSNRKYGNGNVIIFNTMLWYGYAKTGDAGIRSLMADLICEYGLSKLKYEGDVTVKVAENSEKYLLFVFNYTDKEQKFKINFKEITLDAVIAPNDSIIIETDK
jgi:beta-galactosidase GanA